MTASAAEIRKRFKKAQSRKTNWEELYEDALTYAAPRRNTFDKETKGTEKQGEGKVFDSTAINATNKFGSNIQQGFTPAMKQWIQLKLGESLKNQPDANDLQKVLDETTDRMFSFIQNSNFDTQIAESYLDLAVGTGALLVQKGPSREKPLEFTNVPLSQLFLEEGPHGRIETAFRQHEVPLRNIKKMWEDADLGEVLEERLVRTPDHEERLIEATIPDKITVFDPQQNEEREVDGYRYYVVAEKQDKMIVEREMRSSPWVIFRWSTLPGEIYGRGPLLEVLPDVKTLNKTKELLLKAASIGIFGMYTAADDGVINFENIKFSPGAVIPVESNGGGVRGRSLEPLETNTRVDLSQIVLNDLRQSINDMMFTEPLGPVDLPVKTATEVSLRQQNLSKRIGSSFGKLQFELITPLINRILDILDEFGLADLGPFRVDGNFIAIQHVSPLAQTQNEEDFSNIVRFIETLAGIYGPQVAMGLTKPEKVSEQLADNLNIPKDMLPDEQELNTIKQAVAQSAAQGQLDPSQLTAGAQGGTSNRQ